MLSLAVSEALYKSDVDLSKQGPYSLQFDRPLPLGDTALFVIHGGLLFYYSQTVKIPVQVSPAFMSLSSGFKIGDNFFVRDGQKSVYLLERLSNRFIPVNIVDENSGLSLDDPYNIFVWENGRSYPLMFNKGKAWMLGYSDGKLKARLICNQVPEDILIKFALYDEKEKSFLLEQTPKVLLQLQQTKWNH